MSRRSASSILGPLAFLLALHAAPAAAQSLWIPRDRDHAVMLEYLRPSQEGIDGDLFSGAAFLSGRFSLSPHAALLVELPFARERGVANGTGLNYYPYYLVYPPSAAGRSSVGDPYLGVESKPRSIPIFWELGIRLPLASDAYTNRPARITGMFADVTRSDAFVPHVVVVQAAFNVGEVTTSGIEYRLRLSPVLNLGTRDYGSTEAYAAYAWQIGYHGTHARVGSAICGRIRFSNTYGNVARTNASQIELHADFLPGRVRPGLEFRLPLGQGADSVSAVLGGSVSVSW
jgi:hypothetical protein